MTVSARIYYHLQILGLDQEVSLEKVRKAYRRKAFECHPDRNRSPLANRQFVEVSQAYEFLINNLERIPTDFRESEPVQEESNPYREYERNREQSWQEAMNRARQNYDQFRRRNADYKQRWYYLPLKIFAYFIFVAIIMIGFALMIGPLVFLIYSGSLALIILYVPLLILGGLAFYYAFIYKIRLDPYFY